MRLAGLLCAIAIGFALDASLGDASAQSRYQEYAQPPRAPARITVTPTRRLVRECVDWYAIEHRLAGTVVTPQMRCHWAYR